jgi:hypothetical protein
MALGDRFEVVVPNQRVISVGDLAFGARISYSEP